MLRLYQYFTGYSKVRYQYSTGYPIKNKNKARTRHNE